MADDLIRMHTLFLPAAAALQEVRWRPAIDVYRCPDGWLVKVDAAGVHADDIEVVAQGRRLTIRGMRRDIFAEGGHAHYIMEISYSPFERTIELPEDLDAAPIAIQHPHATLLISIQIK